MGDQSNPDSPRPASSGRRFGLSGATLLNRYRVDLILSAGRMGTVYLGTDLHLEGLAVAVKAPNEDLLSVPGFTSHFEHAIGDLIPLKHAHLVAILAQGKLQGLPFIVLQYMGGGSLKEKLRSAPGRRMPPTSTVPWLLAVGEALDFIHRRGIAHGAVSPSTILFNEQGCTFLADFAIARALELDDAHDARARDSLRDEPVGNAAQAPHEIPAGTAAGDQHALASSLYTALAGRPPHRRAALAATRRRGAHASERDEALLDRVPEAAVAAIERALHPDPAERFESCGAFTKAFAEIACEPSAQTLRGSATPAAARSPRRKSPPAKGGKKVPRSAPVTEAPATNATDPDTRRSHPAPSRRPEYGKTEPPTQPPAATSHAAGPEPRTPARPATSATSATEATTRTPPRRRREAGDATPLSEPRRGPRRWAALGIAAAALAAGCLAWFLGVPSDDRTPTPEVPRRAAVREPAPKRMIAFARVRPGKNAVVGAHPLSVTVDLPGAPADAQVTINHLPTVRRRNSFHADIKVGQGGGPFRLTARLRSSGAAAEDAVWAIVVDATKPILNMIRPVGKTVLTTGTSVVLAGWVDDAFPADVKMDDVSLTLTDGRSFRTSVTLFMEQEEQEVTRSFELVAYDRAGNASPPRRITITRRRPEAKWARPLALAIAASKRKNWGAAGRHLEKAKAAGIPSAGIPKSLQDGIARLEALSFVQSWTTLSDEQVRLATELELPLGFENAHGLRFILIPAGQFEMGSPSDEADRRKDEARRRVSIDRPLYVQLTPVTNRMFRLWDKAHSSGSYRGLSLNGANQPVVRVSHAQATAFARWVSEKDAKYRYALPREATWEYFARAGSSTRFVWGDSESPSRPPANVGDGTLLRSIPAWPLETFTLQDSFAVTAPAGAFPPNDWGIRDAAGNVWEWCQDRYRPNPGGEPPREDPERKELRVLRGGSWTDEPASLRVAVRYKAPPNLQADNVGFRLVAVPREETK